MASFSNFPEDLKAQLNLPFRMLKTGNLHFGEEPKSFASKNWRFVYILPSSVLLITSTSYFAATSIDDLNAFAFSVGCATIGVMGLLSLMTLGNRKDDINFILQEIAFFWPKDEYLSQKQILAKKKHCDRLNNCAKLLIVMALVGMWNFMLQPLLVTASRRLVLRQRPRLTFPFPCYFPFDPTANWALYLATYFYQCYSMTILINLMIGTQLFMVTILAQLSVLFTFLGDALLGIRPTDNNIYNNNNNNISVTEVTGDENEESMLRQIRDIVKIHQRLILLSNILDNVFNKLICYIVIYATASICFFGFLTRAAPETKMKLFYGQAISSLLLMVHFICYYGQFLIDSSSNIAMAAYSNKWYKHGTHYQHNIRMIILRSQKPSSVTSLKYAPLTLNMCSTILSTSWSYCSLMYSFYYDKK
ncbi:odorant receptor 85c-like [Plutella xylostella]|uniref:odorant receptor 85c-like n=1 Tax=Plutella xylostella TaxID=51655 RepID=UPI00203276BA|nr:odorant receptor 85c-like [Plutella xylostella]